VKISPVDPEIALLNLKKETEGKYSPVGYGNQLILGDLCRRQN